MSNADRNLGDAILECVRCHYRFKSGWRTCAACGLSHGIFKDLKTGRKLAEASMDPRKHSNCGCESCLEIKGNIQRCSHKFLPTAGGMVGCIKPGCDSLYVTWLNYVPVKHTQ